MKRTRFVVGWVGSVTLANAVAVTAASVVQAETAMAVLAVAALEGCTLGLIQGALLRRVQPGPTFHWLSATLAGMLVGRGAQWIIDTGPLLQQSYRWPETAQYVAAAVAGLAFGALMAVPQAFALRGRIRHAEVWIAARGAGMATVFGSLFAASHALGGLQTGPAATFGVLLGLMAVCGLVEGAIEGSVLSRLLLPNVRVIAPRGASQRHNLIGSEPGKP